MFSFCATLLIAKHSEAHLLWTPLAPFPDKSQSSPAPAEALEPQSRARWQLSEQHLFC